MDEVVDWPRGPDYVQSLIRGLAVIRAFDAEHPTRTLSDIARATGMPRAAVRRALLTLRHEGYVALSGGEFSLRPKVLELGYSYLSGMSLAEVVQPHLELLSAGVGEWSSMGTLDGDEVVYVARASTSRRMAVSISVGTRLSAHLTSLGRVLLASLPQAEIDEYLKRTDLRPHTARTVIDRDALRAELANVRRQGWAIVDDELEEGLHAIAAPVRFRGGHTVAAVNVTSHDSHARASTFLRGLLPSLLSAIANIEVDLDAYPAPRHASHTGQRRMTLAIGDRTNGARLVD